MRTALVAGSGGQVGSRLFDRVAALGWDARSFDLVNGEDLRDEAAVMAAAEGCEAIMHAGAIAHDSAGLAISTHIGRAESSAGNRATLGRPPGEPDFFRASRG